MFHACGAPSSRLVARHASKNQPEQRRSASARNAAS
jgi:hypothetical protein